MDDLSPAASEDTVVDAATRLAVDRTRLAYERTLMAWVRTATSLITFGFSIYKFFQIERVELTGREVAKSEHLVASREFALLMIVIGLVALLMATLEHQRDLKALNARYPEFFIAL